MSEQEINGVNKINSDISTITYQTISGDSNNLRDLCVSKLGRTIQVSNNDFLEYGTKFLIEKSKYNDIIVQNLFNDYTQELIGDDIADIENKSSAIFPTLVMSQKNDLPLDSYFGITITDEIKLIVLNIKVLNNSDQLVLKNSSNKTLLTVPLGEAYIPFISNNMYTLLYIIISNDGDIKVNLAKKAWVDDVKNPLRNLKEYYLRKDELKLLTSYINPINNIGNNRIIDTASGTFVGNDLIELSNLPIYSRKINTISEVIPWSRSTVYNYGDEAGVGDTIWKSLSDQNTGNHPLLSQSWEKSRSLTNYYTDRLAIDFKNFYNLDLNPGTIYPGKDIAFFRDDEDVRITVNTNPGILLKSDHIIAINESGQETSLLKDLDYSHTVSQNYENLIVFDNSSLDNLRNYEKILFSISRIKLTLSILFYTIDDNNIESPLSESIVKNLLSIKYTDAISKTTTTINLGDEREAIELEENSNIELISGSSNEYKLDFDFESILIEGNDFAAKTDNIITFNNYPNAYICDELTIDELSNMGIQGNLGKTYFPDYIIDNKGNTVNLIKGLDEKKSAKIIISPEPLNEINSIITYKVYLTEQKFDINIDVSDAVKDYIIFEKYKYITNSTNGADVRFYKTRDIQCSFSIEYEENNRTNLTESDDEVEIDGVCNYKWEVGNDNITTLKLSAINKSFKLKCY